VARACREGFDPDRIWQAESALHAYMATKKILAAADGSCAVLVKGSRFTHMERVRLGLSGTAVGCALDVCPLYINCSECPKLQTG
jgi:UDP-N-acetylmuramoyl-tripeptide--D-alanyl-D-alanine ligase